MLLARWLLCMKGCELEGGSARHSLWSVLAHQTSRQTLALPWLPGGAWTPCAAWAAVPVSHPWGETCSSDSQTTASRLPFGFALVAGSAGLLCWGDIYPGSEKGAVSYKPPSPLQWSVRGLQGFLRRRVAVHGGGASRPSTRPCLPAFPELSYPARSAGLLTLGS